MTSLELYGLKISVIDKIKSVFSNFKEIKLAILYGSRAIGNYKKGSDIDLTLKLNNYNENSIRLLNKIYLALDDIDLIYSFDLSIFDDINNESLIEHINRVGIEFYRQ